MVMAKERGMPGNEVPHTKLIVLITVRLDWHVRCATNFSICKFKEAYPPCLTLNTPLLPFQSS